MAPVALGKTSSKKRKRVASQDDNRGDARDGTSKRHKPSANASKKTIIDSRFRFTSSTKQLQGISIDAHTLLKHARDAANAAVEGIAEEDLLDTAFGNQLQSRALVDGSLAFKRIHRELSRKAQSLPLILHHLDDIVFCLRRALNDDNGIALCGESVLALLLALLQTVTPGDASIRSHTPNLIEDLISLAFRLSTKQPKWVEPAFGALALIFKDYTDHSNLEDVAKAWQLVRFALGASVDDGIAQSADNAEAASVEDENEDHQQDIDDLVQVEAVVLGIRAPCPTTSENIVGAETAPNKAGPDEDMDEQSAEALEKDIGADELVDEDLDAPGVSTQTLSISRIRSQPHLRHLLASTFAFYVRRIASDPAKMEALISEMQSDLISLSGGLEQHASMLSESISWLLFESCKGIDYRLHSKTALIFGAFASHVVTRASSGGSQMLQAVSHGLTALIHYSRAEHFDIVVETVFRQCTESLSSSRTHESEMQQHHAMTLLSLVAGVRRGSRIPVDRRNELFRILQLFSVNVDDFGPVWHRSFVSLAIVVLHQAKLSEVLDRHGKQALNYLYSLSAPLDICIDVTIGLQKNRWPLYADFSRNPLVDRLSAAMASGVDDALLDRLVQLEDLKCFESVSLTHRQQIWEHLWADLQDCARDFGREAHSKSKRLRNLLQLVIPFGDRSAEVVILLCNVANSLLETEDLDGGRALSAALSALASQISPGEAASVPLNTVLRRYSASSDILRALNLLIIATGSRRESLTFNDCSLVLRNSLASADADLRLSAIQLLSAIAVDDRDKTATQLLEDCESVDLSFEQSRQKCLMIRRLKSFYEDNLSMSIKRPVISFLLGMTSVPIQPVSKEAISVLASIASTDAAFVWTEIGELIVQGISPSSLLSTQNPHKPAEMTYATAQSSFRCSYLEGVLQPPSTEHTSIVSQFNALIIYVFSSLAYKLIHELIPQLPSYRQDPRRFLHLLNAAPAVFEKNNRHIMPAFFDLYDIVKHKLASRSSQDAILAWLEALKNVSNPKALFHSAELYDILLAFVKRPEVKLQKAALSCIILWRQPILTKMEDTLHDLLESSKLRDTLLNLNLDREEGLLAGSDRTQALAVVLRILYGIMISRFGTPGKRPAILNALRPLAESEIDIFVDIMLESLREGGPVEDSLTPTRKAAGFLATLADLFQTFGYRLWHRLDDLLGACLEVVNAADATSKKIRGQVLSTLVVLFRVAPDTQCDALLMKIFNVLVKPRLKTHAEDQNELPEAILSLACLWSQSVSNAHLLMDLDERLLPCILTGLTANAAQGRLEKTLDLIDNITGMRSINNQEAERLQKFQVGAIVAHLSEFMAQVAKTNVGRLHLRHAVSSLLALVELQLANAEAQAVFPAIFILLSKPSKFVQEDTKIGLLRILNTLLAQSKIAVAEDRVILLGGLFDQFRSDASKQLIVDAFTHLGHADSSLSDFAGFLTGVHAMSPKRKEEPDYDRRLQAFRGYNVDDQIVKDQRIWQTLITTLYGILRDTDDLPLVSNASQLIQNLCAKLAELKTSQVADNAAAFLVQKTVKTIQSRSEQGFGEALQIMSMLVDKTLVPDLVDLRCLLVEGDTEANFFLNINHLQLHRRSRALKRLTEEVNAGKIGTRALSEYIVPIVRRFIPSYTAASINVDLANDAIQCLVKLSPRLSWQSIKTLLLQQLQHFKRKPLFRKITLRILAGVLQHLNLSLMPESTRINAQAYLGDKLYPVLLRHVDSKEIDDDMRLGMLEAASALLVHLRSDTRMGKCSQFFAILGRELQNREQSHRDRIRQICCQCSAALGAEALIWAIRELQSVLRFGPQRQVLGFVVNAMMSAFASCQADLLDELLPMVLPIVQNDLFYYSGRDKQQASKNMRESRSSSSKALDSIGRLASWVTPSQVATLLAPFKTTLQQASDAPTLKACGDALTQIANGLQKNGNFDALAILDLVKSLIDQNGAFFRSSAANGGNKHGRRSNNKSFLVQAERREQPASIQANWHLNSQLFVGLGLELLNGAFRRNRFDLHNAEIVTRLDPLIVSVGNALYDADYQLVVKGLRAATSLLQCPLDSMTNAAPVLLTKCLRIIQSNGNSIEEVSQLSLRCVSAILRECKSVPITEKQLDALLALMSTADLQDIERQSVVFSLLRAILSRKLMSPEVYTVMDRVADIMLTNQSAQIREVARAAYLQFLLDYPQGRGRLMSALAFMAKNLRYTFESGRLSVMELLEAIFTKFGIEHIAQIDDPFFVALVLVTANDDSSKCRELANRLIGILFGRLDAAKQQAHIIMLLKWAGNADNPLLSRSAINLLPLCLAGYSIEASALRSYRQLLDILSTAIQTAAIELEQLAADERDDGGHTEEAEESLKDWQNTHVILTAAAKSLAARPALMSAFAGGMFDSAVTLLLHPHPWVRLAASRLAGILQSVKFVAEDGDRPTANTSILIAYARNLTLQLQGKGLSDGLALQCVKNLLAIANFWSKSMSLRSDGSDAPFPIAEEEEVEEIANPGAAVQPAARYDAEAEPLRWLVDRLARQARLAFARRPSPYAVQKTNWSLQPTSILRFFAALSDDLSVDQFRLFSYSIVTLLFRVLENDAKGDEQTDALRILAAEVQEMLQKKMSKQFYAEVWTSVQQSNAQYRLQRAVEVVGRSQEAKAKRKDAQSQSKMAARKRKSEYKKASQGVIVDEPLSKKTRRV